MMKFTYFRSHASLLYEPNLAVASGLTRRFVTYLTTTFYYLSNCKTIMTFKSTVCRYFASGMERRLKHCRRVARALLDSRKVPRSTKRESS
jgi:hypothetical protein